MLDDVFRGSEAVAAGLATPATLRGPRYRRLLPDVYAAADAETGLALRSRAAYAWARGRGVLTGYSAAELLAAPCAPVDAPAELTIPAAHPKVPPGLLIHQMRLRADEQMGRGVVVLTTPLRTAYDLARRNSLVEAVVAVDALVGRFGFTSDELLEFAGRYRGARGTLRLPEVVGLAEPAAESAMESRLRMLLVQGGLPRPEVQYSVADDRARIVARVDLAYPGALVAIEYEGAEHFTAPRVLRDGRRGTRFGRPGVAGLPLLRRRRVPLPWTDSCRHPPCAHYQSRTPPPISVIIRT